MKNLRGFYCIFHMSPGYGKDFIHDHNEDFNMFEHIDELIHFINSRTNEHGLYSGITGYYNGEVVYERVFN